jgi:hypothetical protein
MNKKYIMGNNNSKNNNSSKRSATFVPNSFVQCMDQDGSISTELYYLHQRRKRQKERTKSFGRVIRDSIEAETADVTSNDTATTRPTRSCFRRNMNLCRSSDGTLLEVGPRMSCWYCTYIQHPAIDDNKFQNRFRRRFRCSYECFQKLLDLVKGDEVFQRWQRSDAAGRLSSPIELLLLGVLRYIGRGWTFDDLEENTSISEETHRQFFHCFIDWGSSTLYDLYVSFPTEPDEVAYHSKEMDAAGFHLMILL